MTAFIDSAPFSLTYLPCHGELDGRCYSVVTMKQTFAEGRQMCTNAEMQVASITSEAEHQFVTGLFA